MKVLRALRMSKQVASRKCSVSGLVCSSQYKQDEGAGLESDSRQRHSHDQEI